LVGSAVACIALTYESAAVPFALILACSTSAFGLLWGPTMALAADVYERLGIDRLLAFGFMNVSGGLGIALGSIGAGTIAQFWSASLAFVAAAGLCVGTFAVLVVAPPDKLARS